MKKLLILLAFICFLPFSSKAEEPQQQQAMMPVYWTCYQVGTVNKQNTFVISDIYHANGPYDKHIKQFEKLVEKRFEKKFKPAFEPSCVSGENYETMWKRWIKKIDKANKRKFRVISIYPPTKK